MVKTLGQGLGAFLGGILSEILLPGTIVAGAAVLMGLAALITLRLAPTTRPTADVSRPSLRESLVQTRAVLRDRLVAPIIYLSGLRCLVRGLWTALVVSVALHLLELGPSGVGILTGAAAAGAVVALPITARLIGRRRLALPCAASFAACGLLISVVGGADAPLRIGECIVVAGWGCAMALADSTSLSLLHRLVRQKTLVPVISMLEAVKLALEGVGALLGALRVLFDRPARDSCSRRTDAPSAVGVLAPSLGRDRLGGGRPQPNCCAVLRRTPFPCTRHGLPGGPGEQGFPHPRAEG